jgi:formate dehydrogenase subunit delta
MDIANLVHMANRIGDFHASFTDRQEALEATAGHIHKFWAPRMRRELLGQLDQSSTQALHPLVREALTQHRQALMPAA